jgi:putative transposase
VPLSRTVAPYADHNCAHQRREADGTGSTDTFIPVTNLIESMNARLRKVTRNRGQFPSEQAALKVLYLAVRNLDEFRSPNVGTRSSGWKQALQAFTIYFEGRIPTP